MRLRGGTEHAMADGLDRIRAETGIPTRFPAAVLDAADGAAAHSPRDSHVDRTDRRFVTLDPASSVDLDQAFAIEIARRRCDPPLRDRRRGLVRAAR